MQWNVYFDKDFEAIIEKHIGSQTKPKFLREAVRYLILHAYDDTTLEDILADRIDPLDYARNDVYAELREQRPENFKEPTMVALPTGESIPLERVPDHWHVEVDADGNYSASIPGYSDEEVKRYG